MGARRSERPREVSLSGVPTTLTISIPSSCGGKEDRMDDLKVNIDEIVLHRDEYFPGSIASKLAVVSGRSTLAKARLRSHLESGLAG